jgi:hypothetical protein
MPKRIMTAFADQTLASVLLNWQRRRRRPLPPHSDNKGQLGRNSVTIPPQTPAPWLVFDGVGGSGKTHKARGLQAHIPALQYISLDAYYLPYPRRPVPQWYFFAPLKLARTLITPLKRQEKIAILRDKWAGKGRLAVPGTSVDSGVDSDGAPKVAPWCQRRLWITPYRPLLFEGVGALSKALRRLYPPHYQAVWFSLPPMKAQAQALARDVKGPKAAENLIAWQQDWGPLQQRYKAAQRPWQGAKLYRPRLNLL